MRLAGWIHGHFERGFARFHRSYVGLLHAVLRHRIVTLGVAGLVLGMTGVLFTFVGRLIGLEMTLGLTIAMFKVVNLVGNCKEVCGNHIDLIADVLHANRVYTDLGGEYVELCQNLWQ